VRCQSVAILLAAFLPAAAAAQEAKNPAPALNPPATVQSALPAVQPPGRAVIGVALEGGGALGLAHIGILQWLEEHQIPVDRISGTSMGAMVAAFYAAGSSPAQMRAVAVSDTFASVFTLQAPYTAESYRRRQDRRELPGALSFGLGHGFSARNALLTDRGVTAFLAGNLSDYNSRELDFNQLPIPFRCVATDLDSLTSITFASGPLPRAVRASISIPGVFPPVKDGNGHTLVDGGILDNLPTDVLKRDLHTDIILAIHLEDAPISNSDTSSIVGVLNRAFSAGIARNVAQAEQLADVVVNVPVGGFSGTDYARAAQLVEVGYKAAEANRAALLRYALDDKGWKTYIEARTSRSRSQLGPLLEVRVNGGEPDAEREVLSDLKPLKGKPITPDATIAALQQIQSNGVYAANWESYNPKAAPEGSKPETATSGSPTPDTGLLIQLRRDPTGPPFLLLSPELAAATSNITRGEMALRLVDQDFGGFGSELRVDARIGYMTALKGEYYRLLTPNGYFFEPRASLLRAPIYIWANQKRVADRFQQNLEAGIEAGRTFSNRMQISAEWRAEQTNWSLTTGTGGGPDLNGSAQTGQLRFSLDEATAGVISPNGFRLSASAGALYHAVGSDNAPLFKLTFSSSHTWKESNVFVLSGDVNTYLRANVAQPYRFTLGGPMRLSASSFDEYRGTDAYLARAGYMHRLAALPTGLGHGLYGVFGYEAGEIWSPETNAILRQDGLAGVVANSPIGLLTIGVSVGDGGHRKVFVTLGRWF